MGCSCFGRPIGRSSRRKAASAAEKDASPAAAQIDIPPSLAKPSVSSTAGAAETPLAAAATAEPSSKPVTPELPQEDSKSASPRDSAALADAVVGPPPPLSAGQVAAPGDTEAVPQPARTASRFSSQASGSVSAAEAGDTVADVLPGEGLGRGGSCGSLGGSGNSSRSGPPEPRGETLRARSDLYARLPAVLRTRSGGPLEGVEIGPLLGKGSFGCVYKGRWKSAMVAIKVLEHALILQDDISRETLLSTSIAHPGVVITYRITTVRVNDEPPREPGVEGQSTSKDSASGNDGVRPDVPHATAPAAAAQSAAAAAPPDAGAAAPQLSNALAQREEIRDTDTEKQQDVLETWMLLEYCDRGSLARAIERGKLSSRAPGGGPDLVHVLMCLMDIASAMAYLHSVGVLHGDLKSANVLLKSTATDLRGYVCKLADFGLSRVLAENKTHVSTHTYGTISYMAPELLSLGKFAKAADVYSFAILMWELYSREELFEGMTVGQVLYAVVYDNKRPAVPDGCPPAYSALMRDCWKADPTQRPDFEEVLGRLQPMHDELRSLRRASNSLSTASAPGVSRSLATGLLARTRSSEHNAPPPTGVQAQSLPPSAAPPSPSPLRPGSHGQHPSSFQPQQAAHAQVGIDGGFAATASSPFQQQQQQQQRLRLGATTAPRIRGPAINPFAAAQRRMQEQNAKSPSPETADPLRSSNSGVQCSGNSTDEMADMVTPLNVRANRLAMLHADSPSATQSFATLGTRSEGGWGSRAAYLGQPPGSEAITSPPAQPASGGSSSKGSTAATSKCASGLSTGSAAASGLLAAGSGSSYVSPFQAAQSGSVRPSSVSSLAASSGRASAAANYSEAEVAAKAALRRIADPDAPERPVIPVATAALPIFQKPVKDTPPEALRRYNST